MRGHLTRRGGRRLGFTRRRCLVAGALALLSPTLAGGMGANPSAGIPTININLVVPPKPTNHPPLDPTPPAWMLRPAWREGDPEHFTVPPCTVSARSPRVRLAIKKNWCCDSLMVRFNANRGPELFRNVIQVPSESLFFQTLDLVDRSGRSPRPGVYELEVYHFGSGVVDGRAIVLRREDRR